MHAQPCVLLRVHEFRNVEKIYLMLEYVPCVPVERECERDPGAGGDELASKYQHGDEDKARRVAVHPFDDRWEYQRVRDDVRDGSEPNGKLPLPRPFRDFEIK